MYSGVCEFIRFKVGLMADTIELYILVLVWLALTLIQGHSSAR